MYLQLKKHCPVSVQIVFHTANDAKIVYNTEIFFEIEIFLTIPVIIWLQQMTLGLRWFWVNLANFANILPLNQIVGCQCVREENLGHFDVASVWAG